MLPREPGIFKLGAAPGEWLRRPTVENYHFQR